MIPLFTLIKDEFRNLKVTSIRANEGYKGHLQHGFILSLVICVQHPVPSLKGFSSFRIILHCPALAIVQSSAQHEELSLLPNSVQGALSRTDEALIKLDEES